MIKARGTTAIGRQVLVLGLSFANLARLRNDEPIQFDATPYGYDGDILIFAGRDEQTMAALIRATNENVVQYIEKDAP